MKGRQYGGVCVYIYVYIYMWIVLAQAISAQVHATALGLLHRHWHSARPSRLLLGRF